MPAEQDEKSAFDWSSTPWATNTSLMKFDILEDHIKFCCRSESSIIGADDARAKFSTGKE